MRLTLLHVFEALLRRPLLGDHTKNTGKEYFKPNRLLNASDGALAGVTRNDFNLCTFQTSWLGRSPNAL